MGLRGLRLPALMGVVALVLMVASSAAQAFSVNKVRLGIHPDKIRMVLDVDRATAYRVFTATNPPRLMIDLPEFTWQAGVIARPAGSHVTGIRQGRLQEGVARVVVDLDRDAAIRSVFFLPRSGNLPDRLVVDYSVATAADVAASSGKVFGTLRVAGDSVAVTSPAEQAPPRNNLAAHAPAPVPVPAISPRREETQKTVFRAPPSTDAPRHIEAARGDVVVPDRKPQAEGTSVRAEAPPVFEKPLIIIDAGHGGADPGATGANGLQEKKVTLAMARELQKHLEATGRYRVMLTRDKDFYLRLYQRVEFARKNRGDLFISLHADSIRKSTVRGASIYTLSDKSSDEQTEMLAARENRADLIAGVDLSHEDETVAGILVDLTMRDTMNQSRFFANTVANSFKQGGVRLLDNAHRYAGFAVLKAPDIPSILVEMGFMSNKSDAAQLMEASFQKNLAQTLVASIDAYFSRLRENSPT